MPNSQPLIREIEQVDDSATPMMPDAGDTSATDIEMESPPESTGPNLVSTPPVSTRSGLMPSMSRSPSAAVTPTTFQTAPGVSANSVTSSTQEERKPRIVTGFGTARVEDVAADEQRRLKEGARRGSQRRQKKESAGVCEISMTMTWIELEEVLGTQVKSHKSCFESEMRLELHLCSLTFRRVEAGVRRAAHRREENERGRMRDWHDNDLDRSAGGAWYMGKQ